jgi:hypothetical protein
MLRSLKYWLIKLKLTKPSVRDIAIWERNHEVLKIEYVLLNGNYKIRDVAAQALGALGYESSIPVLLQLIDDDIQNVSIAALNALESINCEDQLNKTLINKRFNWVQIQREKEVKAKENAQKPKKHNIYKWERASKKSFERVKAQLNKPIR